MNISIIIPNYNGASLLQKNIPFVLESISKHKNTEIIVIDDASTDGSLNILKSFKDKITIIENSNNLGFAESVNKGVKYSRGDIIVLLNSDVCPDKDFLIPLLPYFEENKVFGVGCLDKSYENGKIVERGRGIGSWQKGFLIHGAGEIRDGSTLWANGGSSAFKKDIWEKIGGFSVLYKPFYWEDIDLSYRAWKMGYTIVFEPKSIVHHEHEKGAIKSLFPKHYIKQVAYKNQIIFVWKNITDYKYIFNHLLWLPLHFIISVKNHDFAFFIGFFYALLEVPKIIQLKLSTRNPSLRNDSEILQMFLS